MNRLRPFRFFFAFAMVLCAGWQKPLDNKQANLIRTGATTNQVLARSVETYHDVMPSAL